MILRWTGSDTLFLISYPYGIRFRYKIKLFVFRMLMKIIEPFIEKHSVYCRLMREHLVEFGFKKEIITVPVLPKYSKKMDKIKHSGFNILYYIPNRRKNRKFVKWLYGWDVMQEVKRYFKNKVNWIVVDGTYDMSKIYPIVDFYIRCNRHDGYGRMRKECEINNIPYYWSQQYPDVDEIIKSINKLKQ